MLLCSTLWVCRACANKKIQPDKLQKISKAGTNSSSTNKSCCVNNKILIKFWGKTVKKIVNW